MASIAQPNSRRGFLRNLALAAASLAILPSAATYARKWIPTPEKNLFVPNPAWQTANYELSFYWMCKTELGFQYKNQELIQSILHLRNEPFPNGLPVRFEIGKGGVLERVPDTILISS